MTPLPNDIDLQIAMAKAMLDDRVPGVKSISGETIAYSRKVLENLFNQGLSIGFTPKTTQDHMRKADAEYSTEPLMNYKNHGIQNLQKESESKVAEKMKEHIQSELGKIKDLTAGVSPSSVFGFGTALDALTIHGKKVARLGWNGKNMFVYYVPANRYPSVTEVAKKEFGEFTQYNAYFAIKNVDGTVSTWVPSVNDLLQKDWYVVE